MKYLYVLEDGEIVDRVDFDESMSEADQVKELCEDNFDEEFNEVDVERNGTLYSVSETEMVFVSEVFADEFEELFN